MLVNCLVYKDHKIVKVTKRFDFFFLIIKYYIFFFYHITKIISNQPINRLQSVIKMYYMAHS